MLRATPSGATEGRQAMGDCEDCGVGNLAWHGRRLHAIGRKYAEFAEDLDLQRANERGVSLQNLDTLFTKL